MATVLVLLASPPAIAETEVPPQSDPVPQRQLVDALLSLSHGHLWQALQLALDQAGTDNTTPSSLASGVANRLALGPTSRQVG